MVPDDSFTVTQAVNALGFGKFQIILSFVTGLCWMADSMEVMILSILSPGTIQILSKQTRWVGGLGQILTFAHQVGGWVVPKCVAKNFLYKL